MTRRRVIFFNDLNGSWIMSEVYNSDGFCDHNWNEFMDAMSAVNNLVDFLNVISFIGENYYASIRHLHGSRLFVAHNKKELYDKVRNLDEVWEVKRGIPGARLLDVSTIAPVFFGR